jgi:hypothetical protein
MAPVDDPDFPEIVDREPKLRTMTTVNGSVEVDRSQLKQMSFADLVDALGEPVQAAEVIEDDSWGPVLEDKHRLIGTPFIIVGYRENKGTYGKSFVSLEVLTNANERFIVNDGSTGIREQLLTLKEKTGIDSMITAPRGLRVSSYEYEDNNGNLIPAETFYIDTRV